MVNPDQEELDKILKEIKEQGDRLRKLQSSGFQLASYYLVFQGVILTAIAGANTVFRCLPYWLLIVLSVLAALPNLFAMYKIGGKYIQISDQKDKSWVKALDLTARLAVLADPAANQAAAPAAEGDGAEDEAGDEKGCSKGTMLRVFFFVCCLIFYSAVSCIMWVVCVKTLRNKRAQC
ncbi:hypothetical protein CerSpe_050420 [Prunus speciosa]